MGAGNAAHLVHLGIGVVQAADQVIDAGAARVDEEEHRFGQGRVGPDPVQPGLGRAIEIGQLLGIEHEGLQFGAGESQQGHGQGRLLFNFVGAAIGAGAHHATADAADPMACRQALAQQRQQPRQVTGVGGGAEDQGQIRLVTATTRAGSAPGAQLEAHFRRRPFQGDIAG